MDSDSDSGGVSRVWVPVDWPWPWFKCIYKYESSNILFYTNDRIHLSSFACQKKKNSVASEASFACVSDVICDEVIGGLVQL